MSTSITARAAGAHAKFGLLVLVSLTGAMAAGVAGAASSDSDVPTVVLKYSVQSLATDAGVHALYRQIVQAAQKVCPDTSTLGLSRMRVVDECRDQAVARAIHQIDNARLAALYAARSKNG
jgi:UrcA family protein